MDEISFLAAIRNLEEGEYRQMDYNRRFYDRYDPFELSDRQFVRLFRLNKNMVDELVDRLDPFLIQPTRSSALGSVTKVTSALRFFSSGCYQLDVADNRHLSTSQSSVSRHINEVINAVHDSGLFSDTVKFPDSIEKLQTLRDEFAIQCGFPGAIGCIDCTHVRIFPPPKNSLLYPEHIYVNRKNYHSINVQIICDNHLRALNVNAKFPGSSNDNFIWNNSDVCPIMQELHRRYPFNYSLLGDSGYALRPWMLTPFTEDVLDGSPQYLYNKAQMSSRSLIERVNGILKMRWRCLLNVLHYSPNVASKIINTCVTLHNLCINNNLPDPEPEPEPGDRNLPFDYYDGLFDTVDEDNVEVSRTVNPLLMAGRNFRQRIVTNYF